MNKALSKYNLGSHENDEELLALIVYVIVGFLSFYYLMIYLIKLYG